MDENNKGFGEEKITDNSDKPEKNTENAENESNTEEKEVSESDSERINGINSDYCDYSVKESEYKPIGEVPMYEYTRWSYSEQNKHDKKQTRRSGRRNALVFTAVMSAAFGAAICALVLAIIFGGSLYNEDRYIYKEVEKVIYVRDDGMTSGSLSIPEIATKVYPSIVYIDVTTPLGGGTATGIVLSKDGYIVTNAHVVEDATSIKAILNDNTEYEAKLCGSDEVSDLAVIKIEPEGELTPAELGSSEGLLVGESVVAIGCPAGYKATTTFGIISALDRTIEMFDDDGRLEKTMTLIQTNADINPGNSGGALLDMNGKVIGITTLKHVQSDAGITYEGLGFAIPITPAMPIIESLKKGESSSGGNVAGKVPSLGVSGSIVEKDKTAVSSTEKAKESGFYVVEIVKDSSVDGSIKVGDIIISIDGKAINDVSVVQSVLKQKKSGDTVLLSVYRDGQTIPVTVTLK